MSHKSTQSVTLEQVLDLAVQTKFYQLRESLEERAKARFRNVFKSVMGRMSPAEIENWLEELVDDNRNFIVVDDTGRPMASIHRG
jgi:hypothetical protein